MTQSKTILVSILLAAATLPASAASRQYSISVGQIIAAVAKLGVAIGPGQVTLLTDVMAIRQTPVLQVRHLEQVGSDQFMMRLECESNEECLPFFVKVHGDQSVSVQLSKIVSGTSLRQGSTPRPQAEQIVIRHGAQAILMLDGGHVHIRIPVICLENGALGQTIRASDKEHRRIYIAQVIEDGLLRARI